MTALIGECLDAGSSGVPSRAYDYIQYNSVLDVDACKTKCDAGGSKCLLYETCANLVGMQYYNGESQDCRCLFTNGFLVDSENDCAFDAVMFGLPDETPNSCDVTKQGTGPVSQGDGNSGWMCYKAIAAVSQIRATDCTNIHTFLTNLSASTVLFSCLPLTLSFQPNTVNVS